MSRAIMQQALDALTYQGTMGPTRRQRRTAAIDALRAELAKPEPEPIWYHCIGKHGEHRFYDNLEEQPEGCTPLYGEAP